MDKEAAHVDGSGDCGDTHFWRVILGEARSGNCHLRTMDKRMKKLEASISIP